MSWEKLTREGFVFIDDNSRAFWICLMYNKHPMLCYWHEGQKSWVTLREPQMQEMMLASDKRLSPELAQLYHDIHNKNQGGGAPPFKPKEDKQ
jgi:hypothetical protein